MPQTPHHFKSTPAPAFVEKLRQGTRQKILFYGTSLTEGGAWTGLLLEALESEFPGLTTSVNTGSGGEHSIWGLEHFEERVLAHNPDVVFLEFSVNDAVERFEISQETSRNNLETMIARLRQHLPGCELILQVMNPVIDRPPGHSGHRPLLDDYQQIWRDVGAQQGLLVIDHMPAWTALLLSDGKKFREFVPDGLHPAAAGYREVVLPRLLEALRLTSNP